MAPEVIEMEITPNEKADIWSLGCTVIELFTGNPPYHEYHPMVLIHSFFIKFYSKLKKKKNLIRVLS